MLSYKVDCSELCTASHNTRRHGEVTSKRFKTQIQEFLAQDDELWEDAIGIEYKLELLESGVKKLRTEIMSKLYEKKLLYALQWDTADNIVNNFKSGRDGNFNKLTCQNIFQINQKIQKGRKFEEREVKTLTREIISDTKLAVDLLVKNCFENALGSKGNSVKEEVKPERRGGERRGGWETVEKVEREPREQRRPRVKNEQNEPQLQINNEYPTVKIKQIGDLENNFNVVLKVIRIHKQFRIQNTKKIEFTGGDETGTSVVVLDENRCIRVGAVISITNARIYSFHGSKQIQFNHRSSEIKEVKVNINVNQSYDFSERKGNNYKDNLKRERPQREQRVNVRGRQTGDREDREEKNKRVREQRPIRTRVQPQEEQNQPPKRYAKYSEDEDGFIKVNKQKSRYERGSRYEREQKSQVSQKQKPAEKPQRINKRKQTSSQSDNSDEKQIKQASKISSNKSPAKEPPIANLTKIKDVEPADEDLTIIAQIVQIYKNGVAGIQAEKGFIIARIGDDTAVIRAQLPLKNAAVKEGIVIKLTSMIADVDSDHKITMKLGEDGLCERTNIKLTRINLEKDMSIEQWKQDSEEEEEEDLAPTVEDF